MSDELIAWSPRWYDWVALISFVVTFVLNFAVFGAAGLIVYGLLLFAAYRLGKAVGR